MKYGRLSSAELRELRTLDTFAKAMQTNARPRLRKPEPQRVISLEELLGCKPAIDVHEVTLQPTSSCDKVAQIAELF